MQTPILENEEEEPLESVRRDADPGDNMSIDSMSTEDGGALKAFRFNHLNLCS